MSWHVSHLPKWSERRVRKNFSKKSHGGSESFDHKEELYYGAG